MIKHFITLILIFVFCLSIPTTITARELKPVSNIDFVRELYRKVNNTPPAQVSRREHERIIRDRLQCYESTFDYLERLQKCNLRYNKAITRQARTAIDAQPRIGLFVKSLIMCPIMYNLCSGKTDNDEERCIQFERQCIDYTLDHYWRDEPRRIILKKE
ncbi:MAG: hypothetical protein ACNI27_06420 [Desulfovibrio sp.]